MLHCKIEQNVVMRKLVMDKDKRLNSPKSIKKVVNTMLEEE